MTKAGMMLALFLLFSSEARADFYTYKDSSGALVITDKLENVPARYRKKYKVIWNADLEAKDPLARQKAAAKVALEKQEQEQKEQAAAEKKKSSEGKRVVFTIDETTGQLIRTLE